MYSYIRTTQRCFWDDVSERVTRLGTKARFSTKLVLSELRVSAGHSVHWAHWHSHCWRPFELLCGFIGAEWEWGHPELPGFINVNGICECPLEEATEVISFDHICFSISLGTMLCSTVRGRWIGPLALRFLCFPELLEEADMVNWNHKHNCWSWLRNVDEKTSWLLSFKMSAVSKMWMSTTDWYLPLKL